MKDKLKLTAAEAKAEAEENKATRTQARLDRKAEKEEELQAKLQSELDAALTNLQRAVVSRIKTTVAEGRLETPLLIQPNVDSLEDVSPTTLTALETLKTELADEGYTAETSIELVPCTEKNETVYSSDFLLRIKWE